VTCSVCQSPLTFGQCAACTGIEPTQFITPAHYGAWMCGQPLVVRAQRWKINQRDREHTYRRDGKRCVHCGTDQYLTVGHVIPVVFGGKNTLSNYQTECMSCNHAAFTDDMRRAAAEVA
jgi:5-methylcytosine-specific restriction enzyme A